MKKVYIVWWSRDDRERVNLQAFLSFSTALAYVREKALKKYFRADLDSRELVEGVDDQGRHIWSWTNGLDKPYYPMIAIDVVHMEV